MAAQRPYSSVQVGSAVMTAQTAAMTIFILAHGITAPSNGACWIQKPIWPMPGRGTDFSSSPRRCLGQGSLVASNLIIRPHISTTGRAAVRRTGVMTFTAEVSALRSKKLFWQPAKVMLYTVCTMPLLTTSWMGTRCFSSRQRKRKMQPTDLPMTMRVSPIMAIVRSVGGSVLLED